MDIEDMDVRLTTLEDRVGRLERLLEAEAPAGTKARKQSAKEFLLTKNPKSEVQKAIALAYFLEREDGVSPFNVADLETAFRAARERLPKNVNDVINKNIARGFLMEVREKKDSKKAWQLTSTGERFVESEIG